MSLHGFQRRHISITVQTVQSVEHKVLWNRGR
jgi:hypothetical protein